MDVTKKTYRPRPQKKRVNGPWVVDGFCHVNSIEDGFWVKDSSRMSQDLNSRSHVRRGAERTEDVGVPRTSTHWMGLKTTPSCDSWLYIYI